MSEKDGKTEKGSAKRHEKAREKGQVPRSRELSSTLSLFTVAIVLSWTASSWIGRWRGVLTDSLAMASDVGPDTQLFHTAGKAVIALIAPAIAAAFIVAIVMQSAIGGFLFTTEPLKLSMKRMNPASNVKRLFSLGGLSRIGKSLIPATFIAYLGVAIFRRDWGLIAHLSYLDPTKVASWLFQHLYELCWKSCGVLLVWSGVDVFLQKRSFEKGLKMSKQDQKDERKEQDGSPETKSRVRKVQRQAYRERLMKVVPEATVVITNPTHFAVALRYDMNSMVAPVVIAKGQNSIALEIRRIALWSGVPIIENRPLAQLLFRTVEEGSAIPAKLYAAVAEILAFVFKMKAQTAPPSGGGGNWR